MCSGPEQSKSTSSSTPDPEEDTNNKTNNQMTADSNDFICSSLELAANNDHEAFKKLTETDNSAINKIGLWYCRKKGSRQLVHEHRTPLMVAASYGSIDVLKLILSHPEIDVNNSCGSDQTTALHCAASGGSVNSVDVVKLLLSAGANVNSMDFNNFRPVDIIVTPPKMPSLRACLEELLMNNLSDGSVGHYNLRVSIANSNSTSPTLSSSPGEGSPCSPTDLSSSPKDLPANNPLSEKKEYPIDPSLPDIKNSIYSSDEFRMFSFKVRPCSRAYSHDWTECPFVHPGENARRRDPRKYHYSCVPCPEFRKGTCRRGDMCEYAHGVFECWLHPAQYRTRLCKDGINCARRVCFFAHRHEELRPLYASTGSAVPSPRSNSLSTMDMAAALMLSPLSPSANISLSSMAWPQPNVPTLSLPGSNLQSSRLRSSINARDIPPEDLNMLSDFELQQNLLNNMNCFSQNRSNFASLGRSCLSKSLTPSNLDELFSAEIGSSPRYSDQGSGAFSPSHRSAALSQFQQQQNMLSPINTNNVFSPKNIDHPNFQSPFGVSSPINTNVFSPKNSDHPNFQSPFGIPSPINTNVFSPKNIDLPFLQSPFGVSSPRCLSPRNIDPISPMSARLSAFAHDKNQFRSLSSRDLGSKISAPIVGSPANSWSKWDSSQNGEVDWSVKNGDLGRLRRSSSFEINNNGDEPDLSWVQSLVKESPPEGKNKKQVVINSGIFKSNSQVESTDNAVLGAWLEQMQLDQIGTD